MCVCVCVCVCVLGCLRVWGVVKLGYKGKNNLDISFRNYLRYVSLNDVQKLLF